jgi:hypothetical protein
MDLVDVSNKLFFNEEQTLQRQQELENAKKRWSEDKDKDKNWKFLLRLGRSFNVYISGKTGFLWATTQLQFHQSS